MPGKPEWKKKGHPHIGDHIYWTDFRWAYWCDLCGKALQERRGVCRKAHGDIRAAGWCGQCAHGYGFADEHPKRTEQGRNGEFPDRITELFHFTDSRNLESIHEHGILSQQSLRSHRAEARFISTEDSRGRDKKAGLDKYVRLCLHPHHPMANAAVGQRRGTEVVWLSVETDVLSRGPTLYSNTNALARGRNLNGDAATATAGDDQAEVLVPRVPADLVGGVLRRESNG